MNNWIKEPISIKFGTNVTSIGEKTVANATKLNLVTTPHSITAINESAFDGCNKLFDSSGLSGLKIVGNWLIGHTDNYPLSVNLYDSGVTDIMPYALSGCWDMHTIILSKNAYMLDSYAFTCTGLKNIIIPDSVKRIELHTFYGCPDELFDLTSVPGLKLVDGWAINSAEDCPAELNLSNASIRGFAEYCFDRNETLTSIVLPKETKCIPWGMFRKCKSLQEVVIPDTVTEVWQDAFYEVPASVIYNQTSSAIFHVGNNIPVTEEDYGSTFVLPDTVKTIMPYAFNNNTSLNFVKLTNNVVEIKEHAFDSCRSLDTMIIPNSVSSIGEFAFMDCESLYELSIGNSVKEIPEGMCWNCNELFSLQIGNSVSSIGRSAFCDCSNLSVIIIPKSVVKIEKFAFDTIPHIDRQMIFINKTIEEVQAMEGYPWDIELITVSSLIREITIDAFDASNDDGGVKVITENITNNEKNDDLIFDLSAFSNILSAIADTSNRLSFDGNNLYYSVSRLNIHEPCLGFKTYDNTQTFPISGEMIDFNQIGLSMPLSIYPYFGD